MVGGSSDRIPGQGALLTEPLRGFQLPGLDIREELGRGSQSVVYRALREGKAYALKIPRAVVGGKLREAALQLRREAMVLARISHPVLPEVLETGEHEGMPYLVMELVEGRSLRSMLSQGPLNENAIVPLARHLASGLVRVHELGLVHRDIKPQNILLDPRGLPRLIDFGFAVEARPLPDATEEDVAGTFLYCSPEQAGFLKRPIDGRSDLYSLGAMLYECATGAPPFRSDDVGDLIRLHGTATPAKIQEISPGLDRIIRKLLAKDPDDRYQSGQGLIADLDAWEELNQELRAGREPVLGINDRPVEASGGIPLVGRDKELTELSVRWKAALEGNGSILSVEGEPGSGKSRLIRELVERARESGGISIHCKCVQGSAIPFGPLRRAVEDYLGELRSLAGEKRQSIEEELRRAVGESASLLKAFSPGLAALFANTPDRDSGDVQEIFPAVIAQFLASASRLHRGLLCVIDDVQWLDESSLAVVRRLSERLEGSPFLVACSSRNDAASVPALEAFAGASGEALKLGIRLRALDEESSGQLVRAYLGGRPVDQEFVKRISARSGGSPLALSEHLRAMLNAGLLRPSWGRWVVDGERLEKLGLPTDVVQLIVRRLEDLTEETRTVLRATAAIGERFGAELAAQVSGMGLEAVEGAIAEAVRANLLERDERDQYAFVHDKVQEAMLSGLQEGELRSLHQRIAEEMDRVRGEASEDLEFVYALARQSSLGEVEKDPGRVYRTNLKAGKKALENLGAKEAYQFLHTALKHLPAGDTEAKRELDGVLGEACFRVHRLLEASRFFESAAQAEPDLLVRAEIRARLAQIFLAFPEVTLSMREIEAAFGFLGRRMITNGFLSWMATLGSFLLYLPKKSLGIGFGSARGRHRRELQIQAQLLGQFQMASYLDIDPTGWLQATLRIRGIAYKLGLSRELVFGLTSQAIVIAVGWSQYAGVLGLFFPGPLSRVRELVRRRLYSKMERTFDEALSVAARLGDPTIVAHVEYFRALAWSFQLDQAAADRIHALLTRHEDWIALPDFGIVTAVLFENYYHRGYAVKVLSLERRFAERWRATEDPERPIIQSGATTVIVGSFALLGRWNECEKQLKALDIDAALSQGGRYKKAQHFWAKLLVYFERRDFGPAVEALAQCRHWGGGSFRIPQFLKSWYIYAVRIRLSQAEGANGRERRHRLRQAARLLRGFKLAATVPVFEGEAMILEATLRRVRGKIRGTMSLLDRAQGYLDGLDAPLLSYEICRERAYLLRDSGSPVAAKREAQSALALALEHGWHPRAKALAAEFGLAFAEKPSPEAMSSVMGFPGASGAAAMKRQVEALLQLSLVSANVFDPDVLAGVALGEIVRLLGAERAFLFLVQEGDGELVMKIGRDEKGEELKELHGYSRTVVERVRDSGRPLVLSSSDESGLSGTESVVAHNLRSLMAAPLMIRDRLLGVVYLDSKVAKGIFGEEDVNLLLGLASHIAISLESSRAAQLELKRQGLEKDLELAGAVQTLLLPKQDQLELGENGLARLVSYYQPATRLGGDWWWHDRLADGKTRLLIGDVTGHGPGAAMMTAAMASAYRIFQSVEPSMPVSRLLGLLNEHLLRISEDTCSMTMSIVELDPRGSKLRLWNAGGSPLFRLTGAGKLEHILAPSTPLGGTGFSSLEVERVWERGDRLFVFTDGLHSFTMDEGKRFSFLKLQKLLLETSELGLLEARNHVVSHVLSLQPEATGPEDDITLLVVDFDR